MGRNIPIGDGINDSNNVIHFALSLSLQMAWMAATVATITALCIRRRSKKPIKANQSSENSYVFDKSSPSFTGTNQESTMVVPESPRTPRIAESDHQEGTNEYNATQQEVNKELPLRLPHSKMKKLRGTSSYKNLTRTLSMQRVGKSLSMKISRSMSTKHQQDHNGNKKKGNLKVDQDSVWSKAIILGEKCRPDDEDDTVVYDNKGNKISPYHKKTYSNFSSLSRTNSQIDTSHSSHGLLGNKDKGIVRKDEGVFE